MTPAPEVQSPLTFSIVIETENLASGDFSDLTACLDSLTRQEHPIPQAREVLLLDAGRVDPEKLTPLSERYPWVRFHIHPEPLSYYESKMLGDQLVDSDIVVFADSDMVYESSWLGSILAPFQAEPGISIVGGVTRVQPGGPYGLAMSLAWILPRRRTRNDVGGTGGFFGNNVAFRKGVLAKYPIPFTLPLYRRHIAVYSLIVRAQGLRMVRQHAARGYHRPPDSLQEWALRMLVLGNDMTYAALIPKGPDGMPIMDALARPRWRSFLHGLRSRCDQLAHGLRIHAKESPSDLWYLPVALPIALACIFTQALGALITLAKPGTVLHWMSAFENPAKPANG